MWNPTQIPAVLLRLLGAAMPVSWETYSFLSVPLRCLGPHMMQDFLSPDLKCCRAVKSVCGCPT